MTDDDEPGTYAAAARWLPDDVREAIEVTTPCARYGGQHHWQHEQHEIAVWGSPAPHRIDEWWWCPCGASTRTDPEENCEGLTHV